MDTALAALTAANALLFTADAAICKVVGQPHRAYAAVGLFYAGLTVVLVQRTKTNDNGVAGDR